MQKQSVLIIENDIAVLNNLSSKFEKLNMPVITAKDGYEGYTRACKETPNFIITETLLPNLSGFKLSHLLKYDERYRSIKITLLTSNDLKIEDQIFRSCRADVIIKKPFKFSELTEKMELAIKQ